MEWKRGKAIAALYAANRPLGPLTTGLLNRSIIPRKHTSTMAEAFVSHF